MTHASLVTATLCLRVPACYTSEGSFPVWNGARGGRSYSRVTEDIKHTHRTVPVQVGTPWC